MSRARETLLDDDAVDTAVTWYFDTGGSGYGYDESDWRAACRQLRNELERLARTPERMIQYQALAEGTVIANTPNWHHVISPMLRVLVRATREAGLPMLTALVYGKVANAPGPGFHEAARRFGYQTTENDLEFWFAEAARVRTRWR